MKIGYVGLGNMGGFVAEHIARAGFDLSVYDLRPDRVQALAEQGGKASASAADLAANCDVVFVCVESLAAVEAVLFGPAGVTAGSRLPRLIVDNSTIPPEKAQAFATRLGEMGAGFIDAPFSGGVTGARLGTLTVMAGGDAQHFEDVRPILETFSSRVTYMGPVGAGQATKACNQIIDFAIVACIGEAIAFGRAFGIEVAKLPAVIEGGLADSAIMREYAREQREGAGPSSSLIEGVADFLAGRPDPRHDTSVKLALKDLDIIANASQASGVATPVSALTGSLLRMIEVRRAGMPA